MKKAFKTTALLATFLFIVPTLAGLAVMCLWNNIVVTACGFAAITLWQATGLFVLCQILTGGFVLGIFLASGAAHALRHRRNDLRSHWHNMTDEQRREFIERRRREHFGFRKRDHATDNATR